jgi:predicted aspartyl protease
MLLLCVSSAFAQEPIAHKVPFTLKDNMIWIQVKVNGYPATLKLDTGATASVFAAKFQTVHNAKEVEVRTAGGMVKATRADAHCEIGDLKFQLTATYLPNFIDQGVIGIDVLEQFARVLIDFRTKEIELVPFSAEANAAN